MTVYYSSPGYVYSDGFESLPGDVDDNYTEEPFYPWWLDEDIDEIEDNWGEEAAYP